MLFNSLQYLVFLPAVLFAYYALPHRFRWALLLVASYYFYACWKVEYLFLLAGTTLVNYYAGLQIARSEALRRRRTFFLLSLVSSLGALFFFKYLDFVNESLRAAFAAINIFYNVPAFHIVLPIGISFYTFQTLSYTIDVYRGKLPPEKHLGIFALYVSFFPQLVAGPIERSTNLLPQFYGEHPFHWERVKQGFGLILWGFFKKLVIADRLALYVDQIFNHPGDHTGLPVLLASVFFAFQIYCDFSGYTDIAIGSAQMFGFRLMENFKRPFAAKSVRAFWQRWHISLTKWIMDYLYYPLALKARQKWQGYLVTFFVFVIIGLWHGAAWNFIVFGAFIGACLVVSDATRGLRKSITDRLFPGSRPGLQKLHSFLQTALVFGIFVIGCVFFRANSIADIATIFQHMVRNFQLSLQAVVLQEGQLYEIAIAVGAIAVMEIVQWLQEHRPDWSMLRPEPRWVRWPAFYGLLFSILMFGEFNLVPFIYFQF